MSEVATKRRIKRKVLTPKPKRIPVSKIYWKKGVYRELVEDPFNTAQ